MQLFGLAGWKRSGKTELMTRLLPVFGGYGLRVSAIKEARRDFDIDQPGKDSFLHRVAGAAEVMLASSHRWALMQERRGRVDDPRLAEILDRLTPVDLVLVEGFRHQVHADEHQEGQRQGGRRGVHVRNAVPPRACGGAHVTRGDSDVVGVQHALMGVDTAQARRRPRRHERTQHRTAVDEACDDMHGPAADERIKTVAVELARAEHEHHLRIDQRAGRLRTGCGEVAL